MKPVLLFLLMLAPACEKGGAAGAADLSSPEGAARCQVAAIKARSVDAWLECIHPDVRAEFRPELEEESREPGFWDDAAKKMAPLDGVKASDFTIEPIPAEQATWGDRIARYRFSSRGKIEIVHHEDGRWYVVDPD